MSLYKRSFYHNVDTSTQQRKIKQSTELIQKDAIHTL